MKSKLEIYALVVCVSAMICLVISISIAGYSLVQIIDPGLTTRGYAYNQFESNDSWWAMQQRVRKDPQRPSEEVLTKERLNALRIELRMERREGIVTLLHCLMFVVVAAITFIIHWQIAKRART